jgi:endonuclease/exonuclease/phosphatase family metal-dependent hydrolase
MDNIVKIENLSDKNNIIPNKNKIIQLGYSNNNFKILSNNSSKAYNHEWTGKEINKVFNNKNIIIIPQKNTNIKRICSYNVHNWVTLYSKYTPKRNIQNFLKFFENINADILCLQEIVPIIDKKIKKNIMYSDIKHEYNFKYLVSEMKKIGYEYSAISNSIIDHQYSVSNKKIDYYVLGNAVFSKTKFEKEIYHLPDNRSAIVSFFKEKDYSYIVINTHLEFSNKHKDETKLMEKYGNSMIKRIQVNAVLKLINLMITKYKTDNVFLVGDLNSILHQYPLSLLKKKFHEYKLINPLTNLSCKTVTDYILLNKKSKKNIYVFDYRNLYIPLSDHLPIYMDFIYKKNNSNKIDNLVRLKKIINLDKDLRNIDPSYITNYNTNMVTKYILFNYNDNITSQYYLDTREWYLDHNIKELYKIEGLDYSGVVKKLTTFNKYYKKYNQLAKKYSNKEIIIKQNSKNTEYIEDMLFQYIKCRSNTRVITIWPSIDYNNKSKELLNILRENGNIYYIKDISLDYDAAMCLIFQLYACTNRNKSIDHLNYNTVQKGWEKNSKIKKKVYIIFYEYNKNINNISGSEANFKTKLRSVWKTNNIRPYDILHINDYFGETIDYCSLYLNKNSINFLSHQNIFKFIKISSNKEWIYINTLKKILYSNFSQEGIIRFIFVSSTILYILGLRKMNDIDGFILNTKKNKDFDSKYNNLFDISSSSFIPFLDISYKNSKSYADYILDFYNKIADVYDNTNYEEVILNPKYHFYFFGIKFNIIELDIIKRIYRFKPSSWADLIAIDESTNYKIFLPSIPNSIKYYYKDTIDKNQLINTIKFYLNDRYKIKKTKQELEKYITNKKITTNLNNKNINKNKNFFNKLFHN